MQQRVDSSSGARGYMRIIRRKLTRLLLLRFRKPTDGTARIEGEVKRVAILAQEKIGDAILLTPLLKNLHRSDPDRQIDVIVFGRNAAFFRRISFLTNVLEFRKAPLRTLRLAARRKYDLLINPKDHPSFSFLMCTVAIRARYRAGIAHPAHHGFYDVESTIPFDSHVIGKNCSVLSALEESPGPEQCRPWIPDTDVGGDIAEAARRARLEGAIAVNISAGEPSRELPIELWHRILERLGHACVILSMPSRLPDKHYLESRLNCVAASPPTATIFDAAALVAGCRLLVSPDTAMIHVASASNTPVVGLYRQASLHSKRFYPYLVPHTMVVSPGNLLAEIKPEEVVQAVQKLLQEIGC